MGLFEQLQYVNIHFPKYRITFHENWDISTEVMKMKKITMFIILALAMTFLPTQTEAKKGVRCPNVEQLAETAIEDKDELLEALHTIIPNTYEEGEDAHLYYDWDIITALPFPETVGKEQEEVYYQMAKNFCDEEVADRSWLVRIHFPNWEGKSASASEGQIFLAKHKNGRWFVWFRYH